MNIIMIISMYFLKCIFVRYLISFPRLQIQHYDPKQKCRGTMFLFHSYTLITAEFIDWSTKKEKKKETNDNTDKYIHIYLCVCVWLDNDNMNTSSNNDEVYTG